jgi:phosphoserine phosphatase
MAKSPLKLAIFDIDGTLRRVRDPWVHLHKHLGVIEQAKDFVGRWKRGEITCVEWAELDASLWRGHSRQAILQTLKTYPFRHGAKELVGWFSAHSVPCVGISSGLSIFNDVTAQELGFQEVICNDLHFDHDICTGGISVKVQEDNKGEIMDDVLARYDVIQEHVVAFGDGTADVPLLAKAGLGIAICPSNDSVRSSADHVVEAEPIDRAIEIVENHFTLASIRSQRSPD